MNGQSSACASLSATEPTDQYTECYHASVRATYYRNFIFGVEDSLVSTVGLLSGVAIAGVERETILLTGIVLIFVEAFSMAAGSFLSEASAQEFSEQRAMPHGASALAGSVMFISYFVAGFIPLFPYLVVPEPVNALYSSIAASLLALGVLGSIGGVFSKTSVWRSALRMLVVGGIAIAIGVAVGIYFDVA